MRKSEQSAEAKVKGSYRGPALSIAQRDALVEMYQEKLDLARAVVSALEAESNSDVWTMGLKVGHVHELADRLREMKAMPVEAEAKGVRSGRSGFFSPCFFSSDPNCGCPKCKPEQWPGRAQGV